MARVLCLLLTCFCLAACTVCPAEWTSVGSKCYRPLRTFMTWQEAQGNCSSMQGRLPEITNSEDNKSLKDFIYKQKLELSWLGFVRQSGEWKYLSNKEKITFSDWRPDYDNGNCSVTSPHDKWWPFSCYITRTNVVCEYVK